jgi:S1-C subfamily serine protease
VKKLLKAKRHKDTLSKSTGAPGDPSDELIKSGLERLADDRSSELFNLETIVLRNRPVVFVRGDSYDDLCDPWASLNTPEIKTRLGALFRLIGRIEVPTNPLIPYAGTGFVVGNGLVATNRHVAQIFARGLGLTVRYKAGDAAIDFKRRVDTAEDDRSAYFAVSGVEMIHPYWDIALLRVDGLPAERMLRLSVRSPEELIDRNIVVIGYPAFDPRNEAALQNKIFGGVYYVKHLQPGVVRPRVEVQSFDNRVAAMTHHAATLGSNSGSAVIDVDTGEVVAMNFASEYLKTNYAVPMFELARDPHVAPKLNFDGAVAAAWRSIAVPSPKKPKYFVSYAWADPTGPDRESIVDRACEEAERRGITIVRDKTALKVGDSVVDFMRKIGEGDIIFVVLSDKYLRSPYCMFELFEIGRVNRQDQSEFLKRVRVYVLSDAKLFNPADRIRYGAYWKRELNKLKRAIDKAGVDVVGQEDIRLYKLMLDYSARVSEILSLFANIRQPRTFDDLMTYGFGEPMPAVTPTE